MTDQPSVVTRLSADVFHVGISPASAPLIIQALHLLEKRRRLDGQRMPRDLIRLRRDLERAGRQQRRSKRTAA